MKEEIIRQMRKQKEGVFYIENCVACIKLKKFLFSTSLTSKDGLRFVLVVFLLEFLVKKH